MFSNSDLIQIKQRGTHLEAISQQIENFKKGFPFANLIRPAIPGDGLKRLSADELKGLISFYDKHSGDRKIIKFVPASGAASRMFQILYNYTDAAKNPKMELNEFLKDKGFNSVSNFISRIKDFAFYDDLKDVVAKNGFGIEDLLIRKEYPIIIDYLLNEKGLNYGKQPKGLLKFHRYSDHCRIPLEEHIAEAATYGTSKNKIASIHFTVSPEHLNRFTEQVSKVKSRYERLFEITLQITFSVQKSSTDTIAVDLDNNPFRENGNLIFRPGGHGALIENLNDLDGDIIFIKNIDNVVPDRLKTPTTEYKKAIGGYLLKLQTTTFNYLNKLEQESSTGRYDQIADFAKEELNINLPDGFKQFNSTKKREFLIHYLNRPIRVCGMVKNEGEPGGGPFWVKNTKGETSLQIVESSQVDMKSPEQSAILKSSTHFNPVDLVCGTKDYKNNRFDLHRFIDPGTGFISVKSKDGKSLKAQELPGLWNGAMADWITIFVEVPISTFNPVKIVNDLLRPQHQHEDKG